MDENFCSGESSHITCNLSFQLLNHLTMTSFHKTWYECYAIESHPNLALMISYSQ